MPFRTGHHFASKLTDFGRGKGLKLQEIPFAEVARIYEEQAKEKLPLSEQEFREVISAEYMVFGRTGWGGPQLTDVQKSTATHRININFNQQLITKYQTRICVSNETAIFLFELLKK